MRIVGPPSLSGSVRPVNVRRTFDFHEDALHFGLLRQRETDRARDRVSLGEGVLFVESFVHQFKVLYRRHVGGVVQVRSPCPTSPVRMGSERRLTFSGIRLRPQSHAHPRRCPIEPEPYVDIAAILDVAASLLDTSQWSELYKGPFCKWQVNIESVSTITTS